MDLAHLDRQVAGARHTSETPNLSESEWRRVASRVYEEITRIDERQINRLRQRMAIPPERYRDELIAFQGWMELADANGGNPIVVRAQVMTELYVAFVYLRDSLLDPVNAIAESEGVFSRIVHFLSTERRRNLRNAVAHGRWCYTQNFDGLDCWDGQSAPFEHFTIARSELEAWQLLARGTAIATILALTEDGAHDGGERP